MAIEGGCLCGAVRYAMDAAPVAVRVCWCRDCQYWGSGNATVNARFPAEALRMTGEVRWYESRADSGNAMARGFCPACGTPIFTKGLNTPELIGVRAGTLDDPARASPDMTIWTASAPAWALIDDRLPATAGQPG